MRGVREPSADFFGIRWVGVNRENGQKLLLLAFVAITVIIGRLLCWLVGIMLRRTYHASIQSMFWIRHAVSLMSAVVLILGRA
jgi:hypothetical protein